jgi:hypothetical protein
MTIVVRQAGRLHIMFMSYIHIQSDRLERVRVSPPSPCTTQAPLPPGRLDATALAAHTRLDLAQGQYGSSESFRVGHFSGSIRGLTFPQIQ